MNRRNFLAASAAATLMCRASLAQAQSVSLPALSTYLNGMKTARSRFTQYNGDGSTSKGTLFIRRPGRMRFEYDPPEESLVMASGGQVAIFDSKSNAPPQQFPLKRTPLNLILARKVDLNNTRMVSNAYVNKAGQSVVVTRDPENPNSGTLELMFDRAPVQLAQWVITDETGGRTTVVLDDLETGVDVPASLFNLIMEKQKRGL